MPADHGPDIAVLGVFAASCAGSDVPLGGPLQRLVLARLVAAGGPGGGQQAVPADQIVSDVWGGRAAGPTVGTLHTYVSRLRKLLGQHAIVRQGGGYRLDRSVVVVDADCFAQEVATGRHALAHGDDERATAVLRQALRRWRGRQAFGDLGETPCLSPDGARLEEMRTTAAEMLSDALARQGGDDHEVPLLEELAAHDPLRESVAVRLMRALYLTGRQADALAAYERCRRALAEQLGVDPSAALREAHATVLAQRGQPGGGRFGGGPLLRPVMLTNLPPRNRSFVGRAALLSHLERSLDDDRRQPRAIVLTGLAGTGKTETALELAYRRVRAAARVAWWVPAQDPTGTAAALTDLAAGLGIAPRPREQDTLAELWKALDRSPGWVLVFDNADEPAQLRPFMPTAVGGDVVITSRNPAWRSLALPVTVPVMGRPEAVSYLTWRSGDPDTAGAAALAELLGDLPLALEQAGAFIEQTGMAVRDYVRLFEQQRTTMLLRETTDGRTVATTWGMAFDRLQARSPLAATLLETIAFLSADTIGISLLARLATDELSLHAAIAELLRFSLVDRQADTLRVHRLVQDVVRARMSDNTARRRIVDATALCTDPRSPVDGELATHLVVLANHAEASGFVPPDLLAALSAMARRSVERALYPSAIQVLRQALRLADLADGPVDPAERGALTCQLAETLDVAGHLDEALVMHREAVRLLADVVGHADVRARAHNRLGHVLNCADRVTEAIAAHETAIATLRAAERADVMAPVLVDLGYTLWAAGRLDDARGAFHDGLELLARFGGRSGRDWAHATGGMGMVEQDSGDLDAAIACHRSAIELFTATCGADHPDTAQAFDKLGYALRLRGSADEAIEAHLRAVRLLERLLGPHDFRVAMTLSNLGLAYADAGRSAAAVAVQARAHTIFLATLGRDHASTQMASDRWAIAAG